jgi:hypothetical protein
MPKCVDDTRALERAVVLLRDDCLCCPGDFATKESQLWSDTHCTGDQCKGRECVLAYLRRPEVADGA